VTDRGPGDTAFAELVKFLRWQPTAVAVLLARHVDDGRGHCRACSVGGQAGAHISPCTLRTAALAARNEEPDPLRPLG
jgi:hypothetical protein